MSAKRKFVPWKVGAEDAVCVVGVQGSITALDRESGTITIAGHTLPTQLGNGVRLLSMTFDYDDGGDCDEEHLSDHVCDDESERALDVLTEAVRRVHDENHGGAYRFCDDALCIAAQEAKA